MKESNRKVLLLGSGLTAYPILKAIKNLGFYAVVVGNRTSDICHGFGDESLFEDYSNIAAVRRFAENEDINFVVPGCNDVAYKTGVALSRILGAPGYDAEGTAKLIFNKMHFRDALASITSHIPKFQRISDGKIAEESLSFPVLVKPLEGSTGIGITQLEDDEELSKYLSNLQREQGSRKVLVEEFCSGSLHSFSVFLNQGSAPEVYFADEYCTDYPYAVNESCAPSKITEDLKKRILEEIIRIAIAFNLVDGLLHTQVLVDGEDFYIVESMRRCPGDLFGVLVDRAYGSDYHDSYVRSFLGLAPLESKPAQKPSPVARQTLTNLSDEISFGVSYGTQGRVVENYVFAPSGVSLERFPKAKQGIIFIEYESKKVMYGEVGRLKGLNRLFR